MDSTDVRLREVGMRDGLQSIGQVMATGEKNRWCSQEAATGMPEIEVCSFVPVKLIPQFHDAEEVVAHALMFEGLTVSALVPNLKGAERAIATGVHKINFVMSVSESHNQANVRRPVAASLEELARVVALLRSLEKGKRPRISGGLGTAFGCTIEGAVDERRVVDLAARLAQAGVDEIVIGDTVGYANPAAVRRVFAEIRKAVGDIAVAAHFHDTRGLGLANVVAALDAGVRQFDASLGGFGGCPYAPGATGNITMEDTVFLVESMGLKTGIDLGQLIEVRRLVENALCDVPFAGAIARAGLPKNFIPATERVRSSKVS